MFGIVQSAGMISATIVFEWENAGLVGISTTNSHAYFDTIGVRISIVATRTFACWDLLISRIWFAVGIFPTRIGTAGI